MRKCLNNDEYFAIIKAPPYSSWTVYRRDTWSSQEKTYLKGEGYSSVPLDKTKCPDYKVVSSSGETKEIKCHLHWISWLNVLTPHLFPVNFAVDFLTGGAASYSDTIVNFHNKNSK